ncbi:AAA family ATPase [Psittacicella gerlachiana]|uniref:UvrD-like helicase C-terminal domain-containing protein n=1 Tax=Psittacicella gerlachiana TaxID=2028574 RepID=A0A3A1YGS4_9GAMM|nr:AAA family ATPase [Psittacicella gerlachiana]RIY36801.1 hypothetical protein CKF59_02235 [Psittacicella gerlachiana]
MDQIYHTLAQEGKPGSQALYLEARCAYLQAQLEPSYFNALLMILDLSGPYVSQELTSSVNLQPGQNDQDTLFATFLFSLLKYEHLKSNTSLKLSFLEQVTQLWQKYYQQGQLVGVYLQGLASLYPEGLPFSRSLTQEVSFAQTPSVDYLRANSATVQELAFDFVTLRVLVANYISAGLQAIKTSDYAQGVRDFFTYPLADNLLERQLQGQPLVLNLAYALVTQICQRLLVYYPQKLVEDRVEAEFLLSQTSLWGIYQDQEGEQLFALATERLQPALNQCFPLSEQDTFVSFYFKNLRLHLALGQQQAQSSLALWGQLERWQAFLAQQEFFCQTLQSSERLELVAVKHALPEFVSAKTKRLKFFVYQQEQQLISLSQPYAQETQILQYFIAKYKTEPQEFESKDLLHALVSPNKNLTQVKEQVLVALARFLNAYEQRASQINNQDLSSIVAVEQGLSVLIGGPGTGKTTTAYRMLFFSLGLEILKRASLNLDLLKVYLLAPTGKAATHLGNSIKNRKFKLSGQTLAQDWELYLAGKLEHATLQQEFDLLFKTLSQELPAFSLGQWQQWFAIIVTSLKLAQEQTLHSALGITPLKVEGQYGETKLEADIVICDEVGMINLQNFSVFLASLALRTKLILLGDKNQLPAIGEGEILASLSYQLEKFQQTQPVTSPQGLRCYTSQVKGERAFASIYGQALPQFVYAKATFTDLVHELTQSYRYDPTSLIASYAEYINQGGTQAQALTHVEFLTQELVAQKQGVSLVAYEEVFLAWLKDLTSWGKKQVLVKGKANLNFYSQLVKQPQIYSRALSNNFKKRLEQTLELEDLKQLKLTPQLLSPKLREKLQIFQQTPYEVATVYEFFVLHLLLSKAYQVFAPLEQLQQAYAQQASDTILEQAFALIKENRFLSPLREGILGVDNLNELMREQYFMADSFYPLVVTANQKEYQIANGDLGLVVKTASGEYRVYFPQREASGDYKQVPLSFIKQYEYAFFTTIHKAQGDEFTHTYVVLPLDLNDFALSKSMLYTAITRAKTNLRIFAPSAYYLANDFKQNQRVSSLLYSWDQYLI